MARSLSAVTALALCLALSGLGGCASNPLPSLTTGSLFGSKPDTVAAAAAAKPAELKNDPTTRTLQVARIAARAQRCGFNFDPVRLKANFMTAEGQQPGADVAELGKLDQVYTSAFNGTLKGVSKDEDYCSELRVQHIKTELARHLAGDYAPGTTFKDPNVAKEGGLFDNLWNGNGNSTYKSPTLSTNNL